MAKSEQEIISLIEEMNKDRSKTFAEFIVSLFKDKIIEIYVGDAYENLSTEQTSTDYPSVFCGKVVGAFKECLIISCVYNDRTKEKFGNMIFINERAIRALNEVDNAGVLEDMFMRSRETLKVLKLHNENK